MYCEYFPIEFDSGVSDNRYVGNEKLSPLLPNLAPP